MTLITIILALIIEQMHALQLVRWVNQPVALLCQTLEQRLNDGRYAHGALAWALGVGGPALLVLAGYVYLYYENTLVGFLLSLGVLYLTMGFRQFSHYFTEIQLALQSADRDLARRILGEWRHLSADRLTSPEIARLAIEEALVASHRHVFAPLFWFAILGPAGALLYRLANLFAQNWGRRTDAEFGRFGEFSGQAFTVLDWIPVRLTAAAFAIVGDFEDAVHCWRTQANRWGGNASGILLASGAGALGVQLGVPLIDSIASEIPGDEATSERPEFGLGEEADPDFMQSTIGLVWRTLVLVLLLLGLVWVSGWLGG
jgi:adenosylcobinamide-phosphate synthase